MAQHLAVSCQRCFHRGHGSLRPHDLGALLALALIGCVTLSPLTRDLGLQYYLPIALLGGLNEMQGRNP